MMNALEVMSSKCSQKAVGYWRVLEKKTQNKLSVRRKGTTLLAQIKLSEQRSLWVRTEKA